MLGNRGYEFSRKDITYLSGSFHQFAIKTLYLSIFLLSVFMINTSKMNFGWLMRSVFAFTLEIYVSNKTFQKIFMEIPESFWQNFK